jgi:perosamine synthetase
VFLARPEDNGLGRIGMMQVPLSCPDITDAERQAVLAVLQTDRLSIGPATQAFESAVAARAGRKHGIAVNSGTSGLHLCVRAMGIGEGDQVITTPFSFVATTNCLLFERARPVFVDIDPDSYNLDPAGLEAAITPRTKAILPVEVFGNTTHFDRYEQIAARRGLGLLEDCCEALGGSLAGRPAGSFGQCGVFAFYPNKQITTGEGGIIVTRDDQADRMLRAMRNQGRAPGDTWLQHTYLGYNYRMDELSAALGVVQMGRIQGLLANRSQVAAWYQERLAEIPGVEAPGLAPTTTKVSWFVYVIRLDPGIDRSTVAQRLAERGIPVRPYFLPIHLQPYMVERFGYIPGDFPVTEDLGERGLALPFSGKMTEEQVEQVCRALQSVM